MDRGPDDPSERDHTSDQFEAIVAGWRREGVVPSWPADDRAPAEPPRTPPVAMPAIPTFLPVSFGDADADAERFEHFVPPEPPPLPRIGPPAVVGFTLLALAAGLGWLVLRLWPGPSDERDEDDDGAQL